MATFVGTQEFPSGVRRVFSGLSWSAVLAGAAIALIVNLFLNLIGMGIGLAAVEPAEASNDASAIGIGAGLWWTIAGLIALFAGGWVAGRLGTAINAREGAWHGLIAWAAMGTLSLIVMSAATGPALGGAMGMLRGSMPTSTEPSSDPTVSVQEAAVRPVSSPVQDTTSERAAERSADVSGMAALWAAVSLALGAGAAAYGGRMGAAVYDGGPRAEHVHP